MIQGLKKLMWKKTYHLYQEKKMKCDLIDRGIGRKYLILGKGSF